MIQGCRSSSGTSPARQVIDIRRDGPELRLLEHTSPGWHRGLRRALGDDFLNLLGTVAVLPGRVGKVADRWADQAQRGRAVAPSRLAVATGAAGRINRSPLNQEGSLAIAFGGGPTGFLSQL